MCYIYDMRENEFVSAVNELGGSAYLVGGCVRDQLMGRAASDRDYVVCCVCEQDFLTKFPAARKVGNSFPVFLQEIEGEKCEVAFARTERKTGRGYTGFAVSFDPDVTIEDDLFRRDTTMNAMALSLPSRQLIDPYNGQADIANRVIRAVSGHFREDPVRALRAARQAAQFAFTIEPGTTEQMRACGPELAEEPKERITAELGKALAAPVPSVFFRALDAAGLLEIIFPWISRLRGKTQPAAFHPEGDAFEHTMMVLDDVARRNERVEVRFAALMHDAGKGLTPPEMLPHHYGHEEKGLAVLKEMNSVMTLPSLWYKCAEFAIREHMRPCRMTQPGKVTDLLVRLDRHPLGFDGFSAIIAADNHGEQADCLANHEKYMDAIRSARAGVKIPEKLAGRKIAEWIRQQETAAYIKAAAPSKCGQ